MSQADFAQPVMPGERILALDVLRGFAMAGVLVAYAAWSLGTTPEDSWSAFDKGLAEFIGFAVDGKFYTILAFLFGLGFSIQLGRAADGARAVRTYVRRLAVLAGFGLFHALLLRDGDILFPYAVTGFLLIPFRRSSDRVILFAALIAFLIPWAAHRMWEASGVPIPARPQLENAPYFVEHVAWVRYWYETAILNWPTNLTLFLFGFLAGRHHVPTRLSADRKKLATILIAGLIAGITIYLVRLELVNASASLIDQPLINLIFSLHCWGMSSAYAAALLLALRTRRGDAWLSPLAAIGRMALTNYLMQAALIVPLCIVLGLFGTFTPTRSLLLALAIFVLIQLPFSRWWLNRFQFGPAEWLWRLLTYGRSPPLRRAPNDFAPV